MIWQDKNYSRPDNWEVVLVLLSNKTCALSEYTINSGFRASYDGYDITADDDSGLQVELEGEVTHWARIPKEAV